MKLIREMTLTIGGVINSYLLGELERADCHFDDTEEMLKLLGYGSKERNIRIGWVKVSELGFTKAPETGEMFARIKEINGLCPIEIGPHLRLADKNQPCGTCCSTRYCVPVRESTRSGDYNRNFFSWILDNNDDKDRRVRPGKWLHASESLSVIGKRLDDVVVILLRLDDAVEVAA